MAVSPGVAPSPPRDTTREIKRAMRAAELAPASWAGQLATYLQIVLAIGLWCAWTDNFAAFLATTAALGIGVVTGTLTPIGQRFANLSGMVAALAAVFVVVLLLAFSDGRLFGDEPWLAAVVVGLAVLGLDWCFVPRLRARAVTSGALVVPLVGADAGWVYAGAVAWFVGVLVTLWLLERDAREAALRPVPLVPDAGERPTNAMDIVRAAGLGLAIGLVVALLFGDASCSFRQESPARLTLDQLGDRGSSSSADNPSPSSAGRILRDLDASGREYDYRIDELGRRYVTGPDGTRAYVEETEDRTLLRDGSGRLRAEIGEDEITVYGENGDSQTYRRGDDGRIAVPDGGGSGGLVGGDDGRTYDRGENGDVVVRDPDGSSRTYAFDESGDRVRVTEYDEDGDVVDEYLYDPDGRIVDPSAGGSSASGPSGSSSSSSGTTSGTSDERSREVPWGVIGVVALAVAAVVALVVWLRRDRGPGARPPQTWAERLARRLEDEGRRRGRSRGRAETVVDHSAALAGGPLPDARVATVGQVLSSALFGRREPPPDTQRWAEAVVDDVSETYPPPSRRDRRRRGAGRG